MIKIITEDYLEYYECSRCGEEVGIYDDYCDECGHTFSSVQERREFENDYEEEDNKTFCIITWMNKYNGYTITQMQKDMTPSNLKGQYLNMGIDYNSFYIFKTEKYPYLSTGSELKIDLNNYNSFSKGGNTIYFDKNDFSAMDILKLKSFDYD